MDLSSNSYLSNMLGLAHPASARPFSFPAAAICDTVSHEASEVLASSRAPGTVTLVVGSVELALHLRCHQIDTAGGEGLPEVLARIHQRNRFHQIHTESF